MEYCFGLTLGQNNMINPCTWNNLLTTRFALKNLNGLQTVYSEYRVVAGGQPYTSPYGDYQITLNTTAPSVSVNSPAGILDPSTGALVQMQVLNALVGQWITYSAAGANGETVTAALSACPQSGSCTSLAPDLSPPPYLWEWSGATPSDGYSYIKLAATDEAGNQNSTTSTAAVFSFFDPTGGPEALTCGPSGQSGTTTCVILADGTGATAGDIPGDSPSPADPLNGDTFSGYADPSMRGDPLITTANPNGTNLWMLYSWPKYNSSILNSATVYSGAVETHLAESPTGSSGDDPGGVSWMAWCSGGCDTHTPIYPSVGFPAGSPTSFSSHEVSNFWPYVNQAQGTETWYAVHLMYFVAPPQFSIPISIQNSGCLVVSVTNPAQSTPDSPGQLAWPNPGGPSSCSDTADFPANSVPLTFTTLCGLAAQSSSPPIGTCSTWGEPAIMISADGSTAYLAAACFNGNFQGLGYWIFSSPTPNSSNGYTWNWGVPMESFSIADLPSNAPTYLNQPFLTEFDWAERADGTLAAVVTPASLTGPIQYGCLALTFNLGAPPVQPFGTLIANLGDMDSNGPSGTAELDGPNGCTYEPTSNTGIVIVRRLINSAGTLETYSIIDSGILP